jgi:hypothetical protein
MNLTLSQVKAQGLPENPRAAILKRITGTVTRAIVEKGEQRDVTLEQLRKVRNLVYWCPPCHCYHLWEGRDFGDIEVLIGK